MVDWRVELRGKPFGLRQLAAAHACPECTIQEFDGTFHLTSTRFENLTKGYAVWDAAQHLLKCVNALGRLSYDVHDPVVPGFLWRRGADGEFVRESASPRIHGICVTYSDGTEALLRDPSVVCSLVRMQTEDPDVADVVELWAQKQSDWSTLYKVYEIIRKSGKLREAASASGASKAQLSAFTNTANHRHGAGLVGARHARSKAAPPDDPMHVWKAEDLVRGLLFHWLLGRAREAARCDAAPSRDA